MIPVNKETHNVNSQKSHNTACYFFSVASFYLAKNRVYTSLPDIFESNLDLIKNVLS